MPRNECMKRRTFLQALGAAGVLSVFAVPVPGQAGTVKVRRATLERVKVGSLSALAQDEPVAFSDPDELAPCFLVKLGSEAAGGVGADRDVVAFSSLCSHMGGPVAYNGEHKVAGPCMYHLTTFDLNRLGMVVAGHATQSLPQIVLEVEGDDIYATGVQGLIYGRHDNLG